MINLAGPDIECAAHAATGMNSATTMLLALVPAGGHIVTTTDCYRRTRQFIQTVLPKMGISATVIDPADMDGLEQALKNQRVSLFFSGEDSAAKSACNFAFFIERTRRLLRDCCGIGLGRRFCLLEDWLIDSPLFSKCN